MGSEGRDLTDGFKGMGPDRWVQREGTWQSDMTKENWQVVRHRGADRDNRSKTWLHIRKDFKTVRIRKIFLKLLISFFLCLSSELFSFSFFTFTSYLPTLFLFHLIFFCLYTFMNLCSPSLVYHVFHLWFLSLWLRTRNFETEILTDSNTIISYYGHRYKEIPGSTAASTLIRLHISSHPSLICMTTSIKHY